MSTKEYVAESFNDTLLNTRTSLNSLIEQRVTESVLEGAAKLANDLLQQVENYRAAYRVEK